MPEPKLFAIADMHLGHEKMIPLSHRPFANAAEMDQTMIDAWNGLVGKRDRVVIVGDLTMGKLDIARHYLRQLSGEIWVVPGNHDRDWIEGNAKQPKNTLFSKDGYPVRIMRVVDHIRHMRRTVWLCHNPFEVWEDSHRGSYHLHGHCHGQLRPVNLRKMDIGVDANRAGWPRWCPVEVGFVLDFLGKFPPQAIHGFDEE